MTESGGSPEEKGGVSRVEFPLTHYETIRHEPGCSEDSRGIRFSADQRIADRRLGGGFPEVSGQDVLTGILRDGARRLLSRAVEADVASHIDAHVGLVDGEGHRLVVRDDRKEERRIQPGIGTATVRQPRVRNRLIVARRGGKELVSNQDGYRESEQSWRELLLDLKARGPTEAPKPATGDGAPGGRNGFVWPKKKMLKCVHAGRVWRVFAGVFGGSRCRRARNSAQNKAIAAVAGPRGSSGLEAVWVRFGGRVMARSSRSGEARGGEVGARNRPGYVENLQGARGGRLTRSPGEGSWMVREAINHWTHPRFHPLIPVSIPFSFRI